MKTVEQLEEQLASLRQELLELDRRHAELENQKAMIDKEIEPINRRLRELRGGVFAHDGGVIHRTRAALNDAKEISIRDHLPVVVWEVPPMYGSCECVVLKVTKKRIYVGEKGSLREKLYDRETGRAVASYDTSRINMEQTKIEENE